MPKKFFGETQSSVFLIRQTKHFGEYVFRLKLQALEKKVAKRKIDGFCTTAFELAKSGYNFKKTFSSNLFDPY